MQKIGMTRTYETNRDLVTEVVNSVDAVVESKYEYAYGPGRRRESVVNTGSAFGHSGAFSLYDYNGYGELIDAARYEGVDTGDTSSPVTGEHFAYDYDTIGNRETYAVDGGTPIEYTPNTLNQYTSTTNPSETFSYDADGNMTADGAMTFVWDGENRLIEVYPSSPSSGDKGVQFDYDYLGRRVRKIVQTHNGTGYTLTSDQRFVYDGWNVVLVLDGLDSNATTHKYTWGLDLSGSVHGAGGVGGLLACEDGSDDYVYLYDANGNVGQVIDAAGYTVDAHYEYDPYGNQIVSTGSYAADNPFRFSTKYYDAETGLTMYPFRLYGARLGRWLNRDPIGEAGGLNLYAFVENRPTNAIDPDGRVIVGLDGWLGLGRTSIDRMGKRILELVNAWRKQKKLGDDKGGYVPISGGGVLPSNIQKIADQATQYRERRFEKDATPKCEIEGFVLFGYSDVATSIYRFFEDDYAWPALTVREPCFQGDFGEIAAVSYVGLIDMVRAVGQIRPGELDKSKAPYSSRVAPTRHEWEIVLAGDVYWQDANLPMLNPLHWPSLITQGWKGYNAIAHFSAYQVDPSNHMSIIDATVMQDHLIQQAVQAYIAHAERQLKKKN